MIPSTCPKKWELDLKLVKPVLNFPESEPKPQVRFRLHYKVQDVPNVQMLTLNKLFFYLSEMVEGMMDLFQPLSSICSQERKFVCKSLIFYMLIT